MAADVWHSVEAYAKGNESYEGVELAWRTWTQVRSTPKGAWLQCDTHPHEERFVLNDGSRRIFKTKADALRRLVKRKQSYVRILEGRATFARDTIEFAAIALGQELKKELKC